MNDLSAYDDPSRWRAIADANALDNPNLIHPGDVLSLPGAGTDWATVFAGAESQAEEAAIRRESGKATAAHADIRRGSPDAFELALLGLAQNAEQIDLGNVGESELQGYLAWLVINAPDDSSSFSKEALSFYREQVAGVGLELALRPARAELEALGFDPADVAFTTVGAVERFAGEYSPASVAEQREYSVAVASVQTSAGTLYGFRRGDVAAGEIGQGRDGEISDAVSDVGRIVALVHTHFSGARPLQISPQDSGYVTTLRATGSEVSFFWVNADATVTLAAPPGGVWWQPRSTRRR